MGGSIDGIQTAATLKRTRPDVKIIMTTTVNDEEIVKQCLDIGVEGLIYRNSSGKEILDIIERVKGGFMVISKDAAKIAGANSSESGRLEQAASDPLATLPPREHEVLFLIAHGKSNLENAEELCLSEKTVRNYVSNIYSVLNLKNRSEVIRWFRINGLM